MKIQCYRNVNKMKCINLEKYERQNILSRKEGEQIFIYGV